MITDLQMSQVSETTQGVLGDCFNLVAFDESAQRTRKLKFSIEENDETHSVMFLCG